MPTLRAAFTTGRPTRPISARSIPTWPIPTRPTRGDANYSSLSTYSRALPLFICLSLSPISLAPSTLMSRNVLVSLQPILHIFHVIRPVPAFDSVHLKKEEDKIKYVYNFLFSQPPLSTLNLVDGKSVHTVSVKNCSRPLTKSCLVFYFF